MAEISTQEHVLYSICNAEKRNYPFPHFFAYHAFPWPFFDRLRSILDKKDDYKGVPGKYKNRTFGDPGTIPELEFMTKAYFAQRILKYFENEVFQRYGDKPLELFSDLRLVRDSENYAIGPHTDAPWKLVSLLFYLPPHGGPTDCGTSVYVPKDPKFRCQGGPHHDFENFERVATMPYASNTCFGFWKSDYSFHGVEPISYPITRDVLLFNIYDQQLYLRSHRPTPPQVQQEG